MTIYRCGTANSYNEHRRRGESPCSLCEDFRYWYAIWWAHRLRPDEWEALRQSQGGMCYLCENALPTDRSLIFIDHDHECQGCWTPPGRRNKSCRLCRRGLCCRECNSAIGLARDDPDQLTRMAANLRQATARTRLALAGGPKQLPLM